MQVVWIVRLVIFMIADLALAGLVGFMLRHRSAVETQRSEGTQRESEQEIIRAA
jgi:hypothetical protein